MDFKQECTGLAKAYNKKLMADHKKNFDNHIVNLDYFVDYLRYLRDYYVLTDEMVENPMDNLKLISIATAIAEYDEYQTCVHKYYASDGKVLIKKIEGTSEEVGQQYATERQGHWEAFWEVVKAHSESWGLDNVSN